MQGAPIWQLVEDCARELTRNGIVPFTRGDIISCIRRKNPKCGEDSINPIIQGVTVNAKGGAPGSTDKNILFRVERGRYVLTDAAKEYKSGSRGFIREDSVVNKRKTRESQVGLSEDELKGHLENWLSINGWSTKIAWGHARGVDIEATREGQKWLLEVKGIGSRQPMRVNYFIAVLGETLQRMNDPKAKYSIALPDVPQFRGLWQRLPDLAKGRTRISALFVSADGSVSEEN